MHKKIFVYFTLIFLVIITGCGKSETATGQAAVTADIYEDGNFTAEELDVDGDIREEGDILLNESEEELEVPNETLDIVEVKENLSAESFNETNITTEEQTVEEEKTEEFKFSNSSIVSMQNNISISIDNIKHEIKSEYWGKITEITATILNEGDKAFKPKLLVLLYDEKDFKEEWLKPKAEIEFETQLNPGEHITRQAIVSVSFDDINLTKNFKLVLVDAADSANKPIVVVETNFDPLK